MIIHSKNCMSLIVLSILVSDPVVLVKAHGHPTIKKGLTRESEALEKIKSTSLVLHTDPHAHDASSANNDLSVNTSKHLKIKPLCVLIMH